MRNLLLVSHGKMAEGMRDTLLLFNGEDFPVFAIGGYIDNNPFEKNIQLFIEGLEKEDELIIAADLASGSVARVCLPYLSRAHTHLVAGMNLSLLLGFLTFKPNNKLSVEDVKSIVEEAKEEITYLNQWSVQNAVRSDDEL